MAANNHDLRPYIREVIQMLAIIPTTDLAAHVEKHRQQLERFDSIGCLIDPTAWTKARNDGTADDAHHQLEICQHLLEARRAIDAREACVANRRQHP